MGKLDKINLNIGSVKNDLKQKSKKQKTEEVDTTVETSKVEYQQVEPDKILEAMKKHGLQKLGKLKNSNEDSSDTVKESVNYFITNVTPEKHEEITKKVKDVFVEEFPNAEMQPDLISDVVDNLIFEALTL